MLVELFLPLVHKIAKKMKSNVPYNVNFDDLVSDGQIGLLDAVRGFQPERGLRFTTYAPLRIRGAMLDGLRSRDATSRLARRKGHQLESARQAFWRRHGRWPTEAELAAELQLSVEALAKLRLEASPISSDSLEMVIFDADRPMALHAVVADPAAREPDEAESRHEFWREAVRGCNRNERLLVLLYYRDGWTMKEIGRTLGLSESRVSQMHSALLPRLKRQLIAKGANVA